MTSLDLSSERIERIEGSTRLSPCCEEISSSPSVLEDSYIQEEYEDEDLLSNPQTEFENIPSHEFSRLPSVLSFHSPIIGERDSLTSHDYKLLESYYPVIHSTTSPSLTHFIRQYTSPNSSSLSYPPRQVVVLSATDESILPDQLNDAAKDGFDHLTIDLPIRSPQRRAALCRASFNRLSVLESKLIGKMNFVRLVHAFRRWRIIFSNKCKTTNNDIRYGVEWALDTTDELVQACLPIVKSPSKSRLPASPKMSPRKSPTSGLTSVTLRRLSNSPGTSPRSFSPLRRLTLQPLPRSLPNSETILIHSPVPILEVEDELDSMISQQLDKLCDRFTSIRERLYSSPLFMKGGFHAFRHWINVTRCCGKLERTLPFLLRVLLLLTHDELWEVFSTSVKANRRVLLQPGVTGRRIFLVEGNETVSTSLSSLKSTSSTARYKQRAITTPSGANRSSQSLPVVYRSQLRILSLKRLQYDLTNKYSLRCLNSEEIWGFLKSTHIAPLYIGKRRLHELITSLISPDEVIRKQFPVAPDRVEISFNIFLKLLWLIAAESMGIKDIWNHVTTIRGYLQDYPTPGFHRAVFEASRGGWDKLVAMTTNGY